MNIFWLLLGGGSILVGGGHILADGGCWCMAVGRSG